MLQLKYTNFGVSGRSIDFEYLSSQIKINSFRTLEFKHRTSNQFIIYLLNSDIEVRNILVLQLPMYFIFYSVYTNSFNCRIIGVLFSIYFIYTQPYFTVIN